MDTTETTTGHYDRLQELFLMAVRIPEAERRELLETACAGDPELRREVERLLAADAAQGLLDTPVLRYGGPWAQECPQCRNCFDAGPALCPVDGATLEPAFAGSVLIDGRYRIERRLGSGGMGAVYCALHLGLDRRFALKMIHSGRLLESEAQQRFRQEGKALGRLKHPNIIQVTDAGVDACGRPYLVMELLDGSTLDAILKNEKVLPPGRVLEIVRPIAEAIDFAHQNKIIHGDIKPANVFVTADGCVKILDFGVAELLDTGSGPRPMMGTPAYMSAAQLNREPITESADHHALSVMTYELLTGTLPYGWKPSEVKARQQEPPPKLSAANPALPGELDEAVRAGMMKAFPRAADWVAPLEAAWREARVRQWRAREIPVRLVIAVALALLLASAATWFGRLPPFQNLEYQTEDLRFRLRPERAPDSRLALVSIDDATLAADETPLTARADQAGEFLERIFSGQPEAVALDLLLPEQWGRSVSFQKMILNHSGRLKLALLSTRDGASVGLDCISPLVAGVLGTDGISRLFAFANIDDGEPVRLGRYGYTDRTNFVRPSLAASLTGRDGGPGGAFRLDQSIRLQGLTRWSWKDLPRVDPAVFRGRYVLVGAEYSGSEDVYKIPQRGGGVREVSGLELHAYIAATILEGTPIRVLSRGWSFVRRCLILTLAFALFLCAPRGRTGAGAAIGVTLASVGLDLAVFAASAMLLPMAAEYAALWTGVGFGVLIRRGRPGFPQANPLA